MVNGSVPRIVISKWQRSLVGSSNETFFRRITLSTMRLLALLWGGSRLYIFSLSPLREFRFQTLPDHSTDFFTPKPRFSVPAERHAVAFCVQRPSSQQFFRRSRTVAVVILSG
ncbi:hypothetical protein FS842_010259 [Serendipita sp. 407]|nr:hypothetical protein FS842_010259 [Serendipita sp. 407]